MPSLLQEIKPHPLDGAIYEKESIMLSRTTLVSWGVLLITVALYRRAKVIGIVRPNATVF